MGGACHSAPERLCSGLGAQKAKQSVLVICAASQITPNAVTESNNNHILSHILCGSGVEEGLYWAGPTWGPPAVRQWLGLPRSLRLPLSPGPGRLDEADWEMLGLLSQISFPAWSLHLGWLGVARLLQEGSGLQRRVSPGCWPARGGVLCMTDLGNHTASLPPNCCSGQSQAQEEDTETLPEGRA